MSPGYYEAANTMKWAQPLASWITVMAWGAVDFKEAYAQCNELNEVHKVIKWGAQYLVNAHSAPTRFVGLFGNDIIDFQYFGPPEEYEDWAAR